MSIEQIKETANHIIATTTAQANEIMRAGKAKKADICIFVNLPAFRVMKSYAFLYGQIISETDPISLQGYDVRLVTDEDHEVALAWVGVITSFAKVGFEI